MEKLAKKFIDSTGVITSSLSNLVINHAEGIRKINVNTNTMIKKLKLAELKTNIATAFLNTETLKMI